jgi:pSer/pThr/pTyr-binding forkhead associated (FHA) protein
MSGASFVGGAMLHWRAFGKVRVAMRVVCIHPARDPMAFGDGPVRIGSAPDNDIVPTGMGVDPHHATITADARGLVLAVLRGCQRVYVNARAVREQALLRHGDTVTLGANKFLLTSDVAPPQAERVEAGAVAAGQAVLRIVSGAASGQALAVARDLRIGAGSRYFGDLAYGCRIAQDAEGLIFESESAAPRVNGWRCNHVRLSSGDQIVLGEHRLVVEAPGQQYAAHLASLPPPPPQVTVAEGLPAPQASAPMEIWWLIAAAALLAVIIALFLYFRW